MDHLLALSLLFLCASVSASTLESTRSYQICGAADPEIPSFPSILCPSNNSYTRTTLSVDIGGPAGFAEIRNVGYDGNRTRPGAESTTCDGPFCIPVTYTTIQWSFARASAQWSLNPMGFAIPYDYVIQNTTQDYNGTRCRFDQVPNQLCVSNQTCNVTDLEVCAACESYGIQPVLLDDGSGQCGIGEPLCYEMCCANANLTAANSYQIGRVNPQCQVFQAIGPPIFSSTLNVRVQTADFDETLKIEGGLGERIFGFENDLRGFMRETTANPSLFEIPNSVTHGYFVFCDSIDGNVYNSTSSASIPLLCGPYPGDRWFYIPPSKTAVYGLGAHQYGESDFDVLQDLANLGCANESIFELSIPGHIPNTNPFDPTSDFESPSPCTIFTMFADDDARASYWLPPGFGDPGIHWSIDGCVVTVNVAVGSKYVPDAFLIDVDIPTSIMAYGPIESPGYVDEDLSRCYTSGTNAQDPDLIPGFLAPMICNPPVANPSLARDQTYTVQYDCDPAVELERSSDTIVVSNNQCRSTLVEYNISVSKINTAKRFCNIYVNPGLKNPYPVMCQYGFVVPTPAGSCSVFSFGCNFRGEDDGAWYRCIPFWILLAVVLGVLGVLIWYGVTKSEREKLDRRRRSQVDSQQDDELSRGLLQSQ
jgi:hypothetical protein